MAINNLLKIGLVIIPFYELILRLFPNVVILARDSRAPKEFIAVFIALSIGLLALYRGELKAVSNKWVFLFIGFLLLSIRQMPGSPLVVNGIDSQNFWVWKYAFIATSYLLLFVAVSSIKITPKDLNIIFNILAWSGVVMASYVILQKLGLDQYWAVKSVDKIGLVTDAELVGNLGQPTIVSPYIAMLVPVAIYLKKIKHSVVMGIAVLLTNSQMAIGSLVVSLSIYFMLRNPLLIKYGVVALFIMIIAVMVFKEDNPSKFKEFINDNGRFNQWQMVVRDFRGDNQAITGIGPGSFQFRHHVEHGNIWKQAHNEYLETMRETGVVGISLIFLALWAVCKDCWKMIRDCRRNEEVCVLFTALICISVCAVGSIVWHIHPIIFNTVVIIGLIYNIKNQYIEKGELA